MTAVEWLHRWFRDNPEATHEEGNKALEQAKEMEKEQIKIELPSDEEIDEQANKYLIKGKEVFILGAEWMRDKIKGGNK